MSDPGAPQLAIWRDGKCHPGKNRLLQHLDFPEEGAVELLGPSTYVFLRQETGQERTKDLMQICRAGRSRGPQTYVQLLEMWCLQQAEITAAGSKVHLPLKREN